ncbi:MAG: hypothetical protein HGA99_06795 [Chlorobiaceae bacterium]|nr:hypothetical protein [Chlorobiaceae bacterium]
MAKANKPENNSKPPVKVSFLHVLIILVGADLILLFAPEVGIWNSLSYLSDLYSWSALIGGLLLILFGLRGFIKKR